MPDFVSNLILLILTRLTAWLLTQGLAKIHGAEEIKATNESIDQRLASFKKAYVDAFNGDALNPDDRKKLSAAISDFIRGGGNGL